MVVQAIALYSTPPSSVCSTPYDLESSGRSSSSAQKPMVGGLSCLFSSPSAKNASSCEEFASTWHDRSNELAATSSFRCHSSWGSLSSSLKRDHSPVSVFQGPASCSSSGSLSSSLPLRIGREKSCSSYGSSGLFSGFVTHALGSSVDYDLNVDSTSVMRDDELPFSMEGNFLESSSSEPPYAKELLLGAQSRHKIFHEDFVVKAFYEAEKAHRGQIRASGGPYLQHCVETAVLLAEVGASSTVVAAGLLHDTLDDSPIMCYDYIDQTFGAEVVHLVEGVSKLSQLSKLARENNIASKTVEADRLHTMYLAMEDPWAVLIKLADRLHNMMTLDALTVVKQQRFAKETLEIFAPLANRLGIFSWKEQLENLCFKYLNPDQHKELSKLVNTFDQSIITSAVEKLGHALADEAICYDELKGRHKSLYSIYAKMLRKNLTMDEVHDIYGLRLIVEKEEDCYKALRVVHQLWSEVPGKSKDYIKKSKSNGYRSLHTVVTGEGMVPLEIQIRTQEMHLQAEFGIAAHWRYKEGDCKLSSFLLQRVEWARWVLSWQCETMRKDPSSIQYADSIKPSCTFPSHSEDCPYKPSCSSDGPAFVIVLENDKMSVQEFPANSTVLDLMERVRQGNFRWTPYGFPVKEELRPRLNHEPVIDPTCKLKMGDVVELTPAIPVKALTEVREQFQRMYDTGLTVSSSGHDTNANSMVGGRRS